VASLSWTEEQDGRFSGRKEKRTRSAAGGTISGEIEIRKEESFLRKKQHPLPARVVNFLGSPKRPKRKKIQM